MLFLVEREHGSFQAGKAEIEIAAVDHRPRQPIATGLALLGERRERRAAGIAEAEELRRLVESFPGGVVLGLAEQRITPDAIHAHELRVTARNQQGDEREFGPTSGKERREQVALEVMDTEDRHTKRFAQGMGIGGPDEQGTREA